MKTLALVWAVKYFRPYILGHRTTVFTDHAACTSLLNTARPSGKLARWALTIQEMDPIIKHRSGKKNSNANALSRNPVAVVHAVAAASPRDELADPDAGETDTPTDVLPRPEVSKLAEIGRLQRADPLLALVFAYLEQSRLPESEGAAKKLVLEGRNYDVIRGVLYYEPPTVPGRLCVVVPDELRPALLQEAHATSWAGHFAFQKVYDRIRRNYWWQGMRADVYHFCRACLVCASRKGTGRRMKPALTPIPVGGPFHRVGVDILQLPTTVNGNSYVVCFVDYLTKWVEAFPMSDQRAETISRLLVDHVVCRHGVPEELLSDRGANFMSELIQGICEVLGVKKVNTSGYHPQTDGLVEKFNSTLINLVAKCCETRQHDWDEHLPLLLFAYRSSLQESTRETPFYLLYGRDPRLPTETALTQPESPYQVDVEDYRTELVTRMSRAWTLAQERIGKAQQNQKMQYDRRATDIKLQVGDRVMVYMPDKVKGKLRKLVRPFHGPYRVLNLTPNNVEVVLVDKPRESSIFIALDRVRLCYGELGDESWTGHKKRRRRQSRVKVDEARVDSPKEPGRQGPTTRSQTRQS